MIITVAHTKGGVGKSLISFHLAVALKAAVVDLDFQKTIIINNEMRKSNGKEPVAVLQTKSLDDLIKLRKHNEKTKNTKKEKTFIIDVGGFDSDANRIAIAIADLIIVPANDKTNDIIGLHQFKEIIEQIEESTGIKLKPKLLINNVSASTKDFVSLNTFVKQNPNFSLLENILRTRADYYKALETGTGITEIKNSKAKKEFKKLIKEILKEAKNGKKN
jgi:chromosome partitioning protein